MRLLTVRASGRREKPLSHARICPRCEDTLPTVTVSASPKASVADYFPLMSTATKASGEFPRFTRRSTLVRPDLRAASTMPITWAGLVTC